MKKIVSIIFILFLLILIIPKSFANNSSIEIESIELDSKSNNTIEYSKPKVDNMSLNFDLGFINIEDYAKYTNEPDFFEKVRETWPRMYTIRPEERFRDAQMYVAQGDAHITPNIELGVCCVMGANYSTGLHNTHPRNIDEYHVQIAGIGRMQKFYENDVNTMFQDMYMAPGIVHDTLFDADGKYPWHQYKTVTDVVFMGIKIDR